MKKFVILGAVALLSACGSKTEPAADTSAAAMSDASAPAMGAASAPAMGAASAPAMVAASAPAMAAAAPKPGVYDYTSPDGSKGVTTIVPGGTFVDRDTAGKVTDKGKVAMKDGKTCFTGENGKENCYTDSAPAADGSFTSTHADGKVTQVMPHKKK